MTNYIQPFDNGMQLIIPDPVLNRLNAKYALAVDEFVWFFSVKNIFIYLVHSIVFMFIFAIEL